MTTKATGQPGDLVMGGVAGRIPLPQSQIDRQVDRARAFVPDGWALVPRTMTLDMEVAFCESWFSKKRCIDDAEMQDAYGAMIEASLSVHTQNESESEWDTPCGACECGIYDANASVEIVGGVPKCKRFDRLCVGAVHTLSAHPAEAQVVGGGVVAALQDALATMRCARSDLAEEGFPEGDMLEAERGVQSAIAALSAQPQPVGLGMAVQGLAEEIAKAVAHDEQNGGCDISAGMFGPKLSCLIRTIAREYLAQSAISPKGKMKRVDVPCLPAAWDSVDGYAAGWNARSAIADQTESAPAQPRGEVFAWVEHHKAGDNLCWDNPGGKCSPLYLATQPASSPVGVEAVASHMEAFVAKWKTCSMAELASYSKMLREALAQQPAPDAPVGAYEIVALALDEQGHHTEADNVRKGIDLQVYRTELRAVRIALAQQPAATLQEQANALGYTMVENSALALLERQSRTAIACERGELWYWQGDGADFPDSLSCPVVMHPNTLRELLAAQQPAAVDAGLSRSLKLAAVEEQADGWQAVCALLSELRPGWAVGQKSGIGLALDTIRALVQQPAAESAPDMQMPGDVWHESDGTPTYIDFSQPASVPADGADTRMVELLEAAICPMAASGCDGTQYPVQPHGEGEQCQWCYERREALAQPQGEG